MNSGGEHGYIKRLQAKRATAQFNNARGKKNRRLHWWNRAAKLHAQIRSRRWFAGMSKEVQ